MFEKSTPLKHTHTHTHTNTKPEEFHQQSSSRSSKNRQSQSYISEHRKDKFYSSFNKLNMTIILKQTKESTKKGNYGLIPFMNINAKVLNKMLLNT